MKVSDELDSAFGERRDAAHGLATRAGLEDVAESARRGRAAIAGAAIAAALLVGAGAFVSVRNDDGSRLEVADGAADVAEPSEAGTETETPTATTEPEAIDDPTPTSIPSTFQPTLGLVTATGDEVTMQIDGVEHLPPLPAGREHIIRSVDGDGMGGLVIEADTGLWWAGVEGTVLLSAEMDGQIPELLDVGETSFGPSAVARWRTSQAQHIAIFPLAASPVPHIEILLGDRLHPDQADLSYNPWVVLTASVAADGSDRLVLSGDFIGGLSCPSLVVVDLSGDVQRADIPYAWPSHSDLPEDCGPGASLLAASGSQNTIVLAAQGQEDDWTLSVIAADGRSRSASYPGAFLPAFIDIDTVPGTDSAEALVASSFGEAVRFDPLRFLEGEEPLFVSGLANPQNPTSVRLAPEVNSQLAEPNEPMPEPDPVEEIAVNGDPCTPEHSPDTDVLVDFTGDGVAEIWRWGGEIGATGGRGATIIHGFVNDTELCEEEGALTRTGEQVIFFSNFSAGSPAGFLCFGTGPIELVQWEGTPGTGQRDASVTQKRFVPPEIGTIWTALRGEEPSGLDFPFPPDTGDDCPMNEAN